jgi:ribosomal protein S18 acetylase RimI-like enzyme
LNTFHIRPVTETNHGDVARILTESWSSTVIVTRGRIHRADALPGFVAVEDARLVGVLTYRMEGNECEIITLNSQTDGSGIGTALLNAVKDAAISANCGRLWLIVTNDNTNALRFYQKRGFTLVALHPGALAESRKVKPEIPLLGMNGIPIRDEIELELLL